MLTNIKGIGPKNEKLLNKLNVCDCESLISYYPFRYNIFKYTDLIENENIMIKGVIESNPLVYFIKKNFNRMNFRVHYQNQIINVTIFNRAFLKQNLLVGKEITLIGKYNKAKNLLTCSDIKFNVEDNKIEPIYHLVSGLTNSFISKSIKEALSICSVDDYIPIEYLQKYSFITKEDALNKIHFPKNEKEIKEAKLRLVYEELFEFSFKMNYLSKKVNSEIGTEKKYNKQSFNKFYDMLSFQLTDDQQKSLTEILVDMESRRQLNRLLLGDVGSGKTVVAMGAIYANFLAGFQSALMAPTEILAYQHYLGISKILEPLNVKVKLVTGSMTKRSKETIYKQIKNNEVDLLIGTHALLNDNVEFTNLGLVITDEQHRFGVNQRSKLMHKSEKPDILYLSATPIPRTYAMTIYGDLDISMIKSKPMGRKLIITKIEKESNIKSVLQAMLDEIKKGHQVYIVSPLVEQNDTQDLKSVKLLKEKMDLAYKGLVKSEIIHGKMKQSEKDEIMNRFKNNETKILISTTVIEVGIDVPNATMMVIFNAERFGLATLHQLRGRVGRNELQSYCYLISETNSERLKVMEESNDGFYISEKDFELRGYGDLFGTKQSGDMAFKISDIKRDFTILSQAKNDVIDYIDKELYLNNNHYLEISKNLDIVD